MTLKVALVGCGKAADMHVASIQRQATARLVAVCDIEPLMAEQLAVRSHIAKSYSDFDKLLEIEQPDVVHIATPPHSHFPLAMKALAMDCHLLIEKPLALDLGQVSAIIKQAETRARKLTIGYTWYFDPIARRLRGLFGQGVMGDPVHLESFFGYNLKGPFGSTVLADRDHWIYALPGKLFQNVLDHLLNQITEFLLDEELVVQARSWQNDEYCGNGGCGLPDELRVAVMGHKKSAYLTFSSHSRPLQHFVNFYGTKNTAHLDFDSSTMTLARTPVLPGVLGRLEVPFQRSWQQTQEGGRNLLRFAHSDYHFFSGFYYLLSEFYGSIVHDLPVPIPYREILCNAALVEQIVQQAGGAGAKQGCAYWSPEPRDFSGAP